MADLTEPAPSFISKTFENVNNSLTQFAGSYSDVIAGEIAPIVILGLTLSFITIGVMAIRGLLDRPFMDTAWTLTKASIIIAIALTSTTYQAYVIDPLLTLPDEMMGSISSKIGGSNTSMAGQGAAQAIERVFALGVHNASLYSDEATFGLGVFEEMDLMPYIYAALILIGTVFCVLIGTLWLFIAKIILALMIGVGPFFICCLIWNPTQQFFWSWIGQILNAILTSVFVLAIFSIFITLFEKNLVALQITDTSNNLLDASAFAFLGILCMGVLVAIPQYVSALTGAAGGAVGTAMSRISGGAISMGAGAVGGVLGAGRSGYAALQGARAYGKARNGTAAGLEGKQGRLGALNHARHTYNETKDDLRRGYPNYAKMGLNSQRNTPQGTGSYGGGAVPSVSFAKGKK
ncbi:type IV secretion system protein (plasmid) [Moraxella bovis]|uniref:Type IV secretion system protein n=1 Tax=Moraxella bovis TaxID=476 RepID=A0ABY6ME23_MORBO|nr:type IV secretion system protein [Moraxella bovis]UYZ77112.1 type IV secretion system protein [Moraxella bovis]UYZ79769.1 type IV secretion system protein [Moraxella bovis]UYZ88269.1 type IV secretion system protein [Moraxella bovis]UYZ90985.1 type IV secretion system protein [Moraxella bovis]UYZ99211.1 type IV secretion system protein [Moraxella bovis]